MSAFDPEAAPGQVLPAQLFRASWPTQSDRSGAWREMLWFRVRAARACFVALYQRKGDGPPWRVAAAERVFNGEFHEVRVRATDGERTRLHVLRGL